MYPLPTGYIQFANFLGVPNMFIQGIPNSLRLTLIAHDGIRIERHCKAVRQYQQSLFHPSLPVLVRAPAIGVLSTEKGASDTARNAMEETRHLRVDCLKAWVCNGHTLRFATGRRYRSTERDSVGW